MTPTASGNSSARAVSRHIRDLYQAIEAGDPDRIGTHIARDGFGLSGEAQGILIGRDAIVSELGRWLGRSRPGVRLRVRSTDLRINVSESGRSGWVWDQLRVGRAGEEAEVVVRLTALIAATESTWQVVAAHWSVPISNERTKALLREGRLEVGQALDDAVEPTAKPLELALGSGLAELTTYPELYSTLDEQTTIGSAIEEVILGPAAKPAWQEFVGFEPAFIRRGGVRGGVTPDGALGWLATHIDIAFDVATPYRFFYIWQREGGDWKVIASHDSVSVDPCQELK